MDLEKFLIVPNSNFGLYVKENVNMLGTNLGFDSTSCSYDAYLKY